MAKIRLKTICIGEKERRDVKANLVFSILRNLSDCSQMVFDVSENHIENFLHCRINSYGVSLLVIPVHKVYYCLTTNQAKGGEGMQQPLFHIVYFLSLFYTL